MAWNKARECWCLAIVVCSQAVALAAEPGREMRDYRVSVDGKRAGDARLTIQRGDDGTTTLDCDTDIVVKFGPFKAYSYSYRGHEVWKNAKLQSLDSTCNDDGKRFAVNAVAGKDGIMVRVNRADHRVSNDIWLTSYWQMPDRKLVGTNLAILDCDCGRDLEGRLDFVGSEVRSFAGSSQSVEHFRLTGKVQVDLWYDAAGYLVRQEGFEDGHRTQVEMLRMRR